MTIDNISAHELEVFNLNRKLLGKRILKFPKLTSRWYLFELKSGTLTVGKTKLEINDFKWIMSS